MVIICCQAAITSYRVWMVITYLAAAILPVITWAMHWGTNNILTYPSQVVIGNGNDTTGFTHSYGTPFFQIAAAGAQPRTTLLSVTSNGNMGVNVHEPLARLHVDGPIIVGDNQGNYSDQAGMIRFNTAIAALQVNLGAPNYPWVTLAGGAGAGAGAGWSITGNSGTNAAINFIGTTDNTALTFKVGSVKSGTISGTGNEEVTALGYGALSNNYGGNYNTAFGHEAMLTNVSGERNTAVGHAALYSNNTGNSNVAIGQCSPAHEYYWGIEYCDWRFCPLPGWGRCLFLQRWFQ